MELLVNGKGLAVFVSPPPYSHLSKNRLSTCILSTNSKLPNPRLRISNRGRVYGIVACSRERDSTGSFDSNDTVSSEKEAAFNIKLPRRSLLVQFTCDSCGERTSRLINRVAYEKGTVFLQCAGCQVYHKFVDNLGLVVGYDFREEESGDSDSKDLESV